MKHTTGDSWLRSSTRRNRAIYDDTRKSGMVFTVKLIVIGACCGFDRKHSDRLETGPDVGQFEDKSGYRALANETLRVDKLF